MRVKLRNLSSVSFIEKLCLRIDEIPKKTRTCTEIEKEHFDRKIKKDSSFFDVNPQLLIFINYCLIDYLFSIFKIVKLWLNNKIEAVKYKFVEVGRSIVKVVNFKTRVENFNKLT